MQSSWWEESDGSRRDANVSAVHDPIRDTEINNKYLRYIRKTQKNTSPAVMTLLQTWKSDPVWVRTPLDVNSCCGVRGRCIVFCVLCFVQRVFWCSDPWWWSSSSRWVVEIPSRTLRLSLQLYFNSSKVFGSELTCFILSLVSELQPEYNFNRSLLQVHSRLNSSSASFCSKQTKLWSFKCKPADWCLKTLIVTVWMIRRMNLMKTLNMFPVLCPQISTPDYRVSHIQLRTVAVWLLEFK